MSCRPVLSNCWNRPQTRNLLQGPVSVFWDIENCSVPSDVRPEDVAGNIRMAVQVINEGPITAISAYGDFNSFTRRLGEGCQRTGVKLVHVPNGRKDAADKAILIDVFMFALDYQPPSSIMLISGDVDFAPALHVLSQRGFTVILVIPSGARVSSALCNAGRFVLDWSSVAHGFIYAAPCNALIPVLPIPAGYQINDQNREAAQIEEKSIVFKGVSNPAFIPSSSTTTSNTRSKDMTRGKLRNIKTRLMKLLESKKRGLPLSRLPFEYHKRFRRPLIVDIEKLSTILKERMSHIFSIRGKCNKEIVYLLRGTRAACVSPLPPPPPPPPLLLQTPEENHQQEKVEDDELIINSGDGISNEETPNLGVIEDWNDEVKRNLMRFKHELEEILVSYSGRIFLSYFEGTYEQRHKKQLDYKVFGVGNLEELLSKVEDVAELQEDPSSKRKFIAPVVV